MNQTCVTWRALNECHVFGQIYLVKLSEWMNKSVFDLVSLLLFFFSFGKVADYTLEILSGHHYFDQWLTPCHLMPSMSRVFFPLGALLAFNCAFVAWITHQSIVGDFQLEMFHGCLWLLFRVSWIHFWKNVLTELLLWYVIIPQQDTTRHFIHTYGLKLLLLFFLNSVCCFCCSRVCFYSCYSI